MSNIELYNEDCMEGMKRYPDKYFELAIVDPPYGRGDIRDHGSKGDKYAAVLKYKKISWNDSTPGQDYFDLLYKISKYQILFGFNYYKEKLLKEHMGIIIHNKKMSINLSLSNADIAITNKNKTIKIIEYLWSGYKKGGIEETDYNRIHPCEKPVSLYKWILKNYAKEGDKILDTHLGSGSIAIACLDLGFDLVGFEIDKDYFKAARDRIERHKAKIKLKLFNTKNYEG